MGERDGDAKRLTWQQKLSDTVCRLSFIASECVQVEKNLCSHEGISAMDGKMFVEYSVSQTYFHMDLSVCSGF